MPGKTKRPAIVVVLGHVDHGKTTLLDTIRKTHVQTGEAGGITQHIGAYQVQSDPNNPETKITFIDTPGHEAFSKMRSRGSKVADLAILVVAANDGVKAQTKEAISHIKSANIPFIVAINKIDLPGINLDIVKSQLAENEVLVEEYGGSITAVPISAKEGKGISELLEMLNLLWDVTYDESKEKDELEAVVLESYVDPSKGVVANVLVRSGVLNIGEQAYCQDATCRIRSLLDENSRHITKAEASSPAQILGFKKTLPVGFLITNLPQQLAEESIPQVVVKKTSKKDKDNKEEEIEEIPPKIKILLKADVAGTLEAIKLNLTEEIDLVGDGVGDINESDIMLAASTKATIIGFNVKTPTYVKKLAEMEAVKIKDYNIIYHLLEYLQEKVLKLLEPTIDEEIIGKAEIIAEFNIKDNHIAGCSIKEGEIIRAEKFKVLRGSEENEIARPRVKVMQVDRVEVQKAKAPQEVALVFRPDIKFKLGDKVVCFKQNNN